MIKLPNDKEYLIGMKAGSANQQWKENVDGTFILFLHFVVLFGKIPGPIDEHYNLNGQKS